MFIQITWEIDDEIIQAEDVLVESGLILEPKEKYDNRTISCRAANSVQSPPARQVRMVYLRKPKVTLESLETGNCSPLKLYCQWITNNAAVSSALFVNDERIGVNDSNLNKGSTWMSFSLTERNASESVSVTCTVENEVASVKETIIVGACKYKYTCL